METKKRFLRIAIGLVFLLIVASIAFFLLVSYDGFCHWVLKVTNKEHKLAFFQNNVLTPSKFSLIKIAVAGIGAVFLLIAAFVFYKIDKLYALLASIAASLKTIVNDELAFFRGLKRETKISLSIILLLQGALAMYFIITIPVFVDEAWTFLNFTKNGPVVSATYYPAPNNHIFFSLLTSITYYLPFDKLINMRLVNLVVAALSCLAFFQVITRFFGERIALLLTAFYVSSFMILLYSVQARGYGLVCLWFIIMVNAMFSFYYGKRSNGKLFVYILSVVLGFYSIPSFLYPFVSANLFFYALLLFGKEFQLLKRVTIANIIAGAGTLMLYLPIIAMNGLSAVTSNKFTKPLPRAETIAKLPEHLYAVSNWLFSLPYGWGAVFISVAVLLLIAAFVLVKDNKKLKVLAAFLLVVVLMPPVLIIGQSVIPFPRTWVYQCFVVIAAYGILFYWLANRFSNIKVPVVLFNVLIVAVIGANSYQFSQQHRLYYAEDYKIDAALNQVALDNVQSLASEDVNLADMITYTIQVKNPHSRVVTLPVDSVNAGNMPDMIIASRGKVNDTILGNYLASQQLGKLTFYNLVKR